MGKKNGKKLGNDDRFLIFYNFCCNCTFYMRSKYVGGMVWQFCIPRARAKYVHPKGTSRRHRSNPILVTLPEEDRFVEGCALLLSPASPLRSYFGSFTFVNILLFEIQFVNW